MSLAARVRASVGFHGRQLALSVAHNVALAPNGIPDRPRVYLPSALHRRHPCWETYETHPPLAYVAYPVAEMAHWFTCTPRLLRKSFIIEVEHVLAMGRDISDWSRGLRAVTRINETIASDRCRDVLFFSRGLAEHSRPYVWPELWPKLSVVRLAYPSQDVYVPPPRPFTILTIASRWSDKGVPEVLDVFRALRQSFGREVRMILVCDVVPADVTLPDGVEHVNVPRMDDAMKALMYRAADALVLPCYSETICCFNEAYAFAVPVVTTRIHHGDEFVVEGETGHLVDAPVHSYSGGYGVRWRTWPEFLDDLARRRRRGELGPVVDATLEALRGMIRDRDRLARMRSAARRFHAAHLTPERRNEKLRAAYARATQSTP